MIRKFLIICTGLVAAVIAGALTLRIVRGAQNTAVPDVHGETLAQATKSAGRNRLRIKVTGQKNDSKAPAGTVLEQDPPARSQIKEARTLRVVLSKGPRKMRVPNIRGQALRAARIRLDQAGVPVRRILEAPSSAPDDTILYQVPDPGEAETVGDGILIVVARNGSHRDYVMPDLIGKSVDDVARAFRERGFVPPQIRYRSYPGLGRGTILAQSPLAGYRLNPRAAVVFEVSQGG